MKPRILAGTYARKLIREKWDGEARSYLQLSRSCRKALNTYMGQGWTSKIWTTKFKFGLIRMSMAEFIAYVMNSPDFRDSESQFAGWDHYHDWYMTMVSAGHGHGAKDEVKEVWPVILGEDAGEAIQDGWHRLHYYYDHGVKTVPALFYIQFKRIDWLKEVG